MTTLAIESHKDDSVTLTVGSITARIRGESWAEANKTAHLLGEMLVAKEEVKALLQKLRFMAETARDAERALENAERLIRDLAL